METYNIDGWIDLPDEVDAVESEVGVFGSAASFLTGTGKGKIYCFHDSYLKIGMEFPVLNQGSIGTCVAFGTGGATDGLKASEISDGQREKFVAITATEPIYYGARITVGGGRIRGDGAVVANAVKYITEWGTIARGKYDGVDLTEYSVDRAREWGNGKGFPKNIELIQKDHLIRQFTRVKSWEEARDSVANKCPVIFGSGYGFSSETDDEGFCKQNTSWNHCMWLCGIDDNSKRNGGLIANSWGRNWLKIRKRKLNQPDGTFWADAEIIDKIMRNGDCWSISDFSGYKNKIDTSISW